MSSDQPAGSARDESSTERSTKADTAGNFVLTGCDLSDLGEELRAVVEKRIARCESLGEPETADLYRRAFDLAQETLEEICQRPEERG